MTILDFIKANHAGKDVHVVDLTDGWHNHVGYYFWDSAHNVHKLQLIARLRKDDGWEVKDIREMCALCLPVHVVIVEGQFKEA